MKSKGFAYIGDTIPEPEPAFLENLQIAILHSLEQQRLLTASQAEKCLRTIQNHEAESP